MTRFSVIGAGAWATTIAKILAENGQNVTLFCHRDAYAKVIQETRVNTIALPGVLLPVSIQVSLDFDTSIDRCDAIILGVPSRFILPYLTRLQGFNSRPILSIIKGIIEDKNWLISDYVHHNLGWNYAVLSGPNLASEIAAGNPAASVIASHTELTALSFQKALMRPYFRIYTSTDVTGVELGGILKNIIAIAAGVCDGLKLGSNAKAALLTRGLREMTLIGEKLQAHPPTFYGLSGLGDLMATSHSSLSRNWQIGYRISQGIVEEEVRLGSAIPEGVRTTLFIEKFAKENALHLPIIETVCTLIRRECSPQFAMAKLMDRNPRSE